MSIRYPEFVTLYLYCMRDHNTGLNPVWEYLGRSEMQQNWYAYEYLHHRFLKKASLEAGAVASRIAFAAAFGAASGAIAGPAGAGIGAAAGAVGTTVDRALSITARSSITKGKRQWRLHKARQAMGSHTQNIDLSFLSANADFFRLMTSDGYYFWPGYAKSRLPMTQWLSSPTSVSERLKARLFFKPPKSGKRINNYNFSYTCMLYSVNDSSRKQFDIIWQVSKFWPMLDYHFFNQSFYTQLQNCKIHFSTLAPKALLQTRVCPSSELLKSFLFTTRYYFLSRDFYLDHFFSQALPKYEMILSRPYREDVNEGGVTGFNIFGNFLEILQHKISAVVADTEVIKKIHITNAISREILSACVPHLADLPTEMKIEFQTCMRQMFLEYRNLEIFDDAGISTPQITQQNEKGFALEQNEDEFDSIIERKDYSNKQKKIHLRMLMQTRRQILACTNFSSVDSQIDQARVWAALLQIVGEPIAVGMRTGPELADWNSALKEKMSDSKEIAQLTGGAVFAGIKISTEIIGAFASDAMTSRLSPNQKEMFLKLQRIYGGIRLLGGMAEFVCQASSGSSLLETVGIGGATGAVTSVLLIGPNLMNVLVAYAVQRSKNFLYHRMDEICLSVVDRLIIKDTKALKPSVYSRTMERSVQHKVGSSQALQSFDVVSGIISATNYAADAQIFVNSSEEFSNSSLHLPGVISAWEYGEPSYIDIKYQQGEPVVGVPPGTRIFLSGSCALRGVHILLYAASATRFYSHLMNVNQYLVMIKAWYRATQAAFKLLQLEKSIQIQEKTKSHKFSYIETQDVYDAVLNFIEIIRDDKKEFINLLKQCEQTSAQFSHLPSFIKTQHAYMRVLYLCGVRLCKNLFKRFEDAFKPSALYEGVPFLIQICSSTLMGIQKSQLNYEGLDEPSNEFGNLHYLTTRLKLDMQIDYLASIKTQTISHIPAAPFRDFSDLGLGFKFSKDPNLMNESEKSCLYKDFGRVLRHLFESAPEPSKIYGLQDNLKKLLQKISARDTPLNRKLISDFIDAYFEYSRTLLHLNVFIYYARVYEFIQETVRIDFLNSTLTLRSQIIQDLNNPLSALNTASPGEYKNSLEEIKLMCEQLNTEHENIR